MLWSEVLKQAKLTKQNYNRLYKQKQIRDLDIKENENAKKRAMRSYPDSKKRQMKEETKNCA